MKNLTKTLGLSLLMSLSFYCSANSKSTILLSETKGVFIIDFLNENNVTAFQFDIVLSTNNEFTKTDVSSCMSSLVKTHMGTCKLKGNKLRVIVFSQNNSILNTGKIGTFKLPNTNNKITIENVEFVSPDAGVVNGEVLVDRFNREIFNENTRK